MIKRFFNKAWVLTTIVFICFWMGLNLIITSICYALGNPLLGETEFWPAFWNMTIVEFIILGGFALIMVAMVWFIKGIRKGLKEEKKRYGNKHRNKHR